MKQELWKNEYARMISLMIGADPLIGRASIAEKLAIPEDDLYEFLGLNWLDRAANAALTKHNAAETRRAPE